MNTAPAAGERATAELVATGLAKIGLVLRHEAWAERERTGLTPTQSQILALLRARGPASLAAIAGELAVSLPTASDSIASLAAKGLVDKRPGRPLVVAPTTAGLRLAQRTARWPDFLLEAIDELTPEDQSAFLRGLTAMIASLQRRGRIPVARMCASCRFFRPNVHPDPLRPHHCAFVDAPFGDRQLRLDCSDWQAREHEEAG